MGISSRFTITEPHPTVAQNTYIHAGRGGAGNHFRAPLTTAPSGVPTPVYPVRTNSSTASASSNTSSSSSSSSGRFYSGRGGAGNAHSHLERPTISFEDEFSRADKRGEVQARSGYHVGRGGAGNFTSGLMGTSSKKTRQGSSSSSSSSGSSGSGVLRRLGDVFKH